MTRLVIVSRQGKKEQSQKVVLRESKDEGKGQTGGVRNGMGSIRPFSYSRNGAGSLLLFLGVCGRPLNGSTGIH